MCHSGSISQIIKPVEREWHLNSRFLPLFFFPFLSIFSPAQCSLPYSILSHAPRLLISILQRNKLWCTSLLALPDLLILPHTVFHVVWDFPFLSFVSPHCLCSVLWVLLYELMNWSWELALVTKIWKKLKFQIDNSSQTCPNRTSTERQDLSSCLWCQLTDPLPWHLHFFQLFQGSW